MKLVHLAPQALLGMISRRGLRLGDGRWGRGIYAVPLLRMPRFSDHVRRQRNDHSVPVSTLSLWRAVLFREASPRGRRPVAVVFSLPKRCWPVDVYLMVWPGMVPMILALLRDQPSTGLEVTRQALVELSKAASVGAGSMLAVKVHGPVDLGRLFEHYLKAGAWCDLFDDQVEIVIRAPVPASAIHRLVPLSQTNVQAKLRAVKQARMAARD